MEISNTVILITGASTGIGRVVATHLHRLGAHLILAARSAEPLHALADGLDGSLAVPTDVTDQRAAIRLVDAATERFGRIDVLINNAGRAMARPVEHIDLAELTDLIEVFGFVEHVRIGEGHRSQLGLPDGPSAEVVVAEVRPGRRTPQQGRSHQVMLKVEDVARVVEVAVARGATLADPQHDWEYGERQATIDDPFGHQWVLNQTLIEVAPEEWGGLSVTPRPAAR